MAEVSISRVKPILQDRFIHIWKLCMLQDKTIVPA
jgi:hypothetical protein